MRYIIGLFAAIVLVILLIIILATGGNNTPSEVPNSQRKLQDYANTDAVVRMTVSGPIVANEEHRETRITVGRDAVTIDSIIGYQGDVVDTETSGNTRESYFSFLRAIDRAGFTKGNTDENLRDERGYCALGKRYIFELIDSGRTVQRFWATSCKGTKTYEGNLGTTTTLFSRQAPDYDRFVSRNDAIDI